MSGQPSTIAIVGMVLGVIGTLGWLITSLLCCVLWKATRKELLMMKRKLDRGVTNPSYVDPNMAPIPEPPEPSDIPSATPISTRQPKPSEASKGGYSLVNNLSVLPGDMRTATNLMGGTIPTDQESLLLEKYRKERAEYEEQQLLKMAELKAMREGGASRGPAVPEGGVMYEDVDPSSTNTIRAEVQKAPAEINPYQFPADAVTLAPVKVAGMVKKSPNKLSMGTNVVGNDSYTPVFGTLPKGHVLEKVPPAHPQPRTRALSDSSQPSSSLKATTVSYENSSVMSHSPEQARKAAQSGGSGGEGVGERADGNRVSKRKVAKEVVEFDPHKQKKFRMTSDPRKKLDGNSDNLGNQLESGIAESFESRPFSIHSDQQGLSYAMVNMEDKKRYRLEANATKSEGSGTPQHYRVPIASS